MSVGAITNTLFSTASATASAAGGGNFAAAMSAATGASSPAATSTVSNPFSQMGTDLQSLLVQLGGSSEAKDISATTASANSTAALHGSHAHGHHHGANAKEGSGDLATDFANNTIN